tara:strand:+ start:196 stop:387 length:192 start_codon:yes stop_codon:yes gene_type:complete
VEGIKKQKETLKKVNSDDISKKSSKKKRTADYSTIEKLEKEIDESQIKKGTKRKAKRAKIERS